MHSFEAHYSATGWPAVVLHAAIALIIVGYLIIAFQFWLAKKSHGSGAPMAGVSAVFLRERAGRAFMQLLVIFILCGLSGYVPRLISVPINLFILTHVLLAAAAWRYILSRQAVIIAVAMSSRDRP
jgi:hypothetical protein